MSFSRTCVLAGSRNIARIDEPFAADEKFPHGFRLRDGPCVTTGLEFLGAGHCITSRATAQRLDDAGAPVGHDAGEALPSLVEGDELSSGLIVQGY